MSIDYDYHSELETIGDNIRAIREEFAMIRALLERLVALRTGPVTISDVRYKISD